MPSLGQWGYILLGTYREWREDDVLRIAAALSYFALIAIAPLLVIAIAVAGVVFGTAEAQSQVAMQLRNIIGNDASLALLDLMRGFRTTGSNWLTALIGVGVLIFASTNLFSHAEHFLNTIWSIEQPTESMWWVVLQRRLRSFLLVLFIGFVLLLAIGLNAALDPFLTQLPAPLELELLAQVMSILISVLILTGLFAMLYEVLPDAPIRLQYVLPGAIFTSLLFQIGQMLFGAYLSVSNIASAYETTGAFIVLLIWVYYSMNIFLIGAEFTQVYAHTTEQGSDEGIGQLSADD